MPAPSDARAYRGKIYATYNSHQASSAHTHTPAEYASKAADLRVRVGRWLPADRAAPILDIGCGAGYFLHLLTGMGYTDVTGVDLSPEQVPHARAAAPGANVIHGDALELLATSPGRFALISGFDFVEHFGKDEVFPLLDLLFAALRPGGVLLLQTPNAASPFGGMLRYGDLTHEIAFSPHSLAHALRMSGFEDVESRECTPRVHGPASAVRRVLWGAIRAGVAAWNLVETGSPQGGVYTRVFVAAARRPQAPAAPPA